MSVRNLFRIAVASIAAMMLPCILPAQNSGVASDGTARLMWRATDSHISLWSLDAPNNTILGTHEYGPYYSWLPIALTTANNGNSYILWRNTNGSISLWLVDANLNYVNSLVYGPYAGWTAESLSVETTNTNNFRVLWRSTDGLVSIWIVDSALNLISARNFGPFFGFDPTPGTAVRKGAPRPQSGNNQEVDAKAAAAMK